MTARSSAAPAFSVANAVALVLALALPALLGAPQDVHRLSAAMFTVGFPCSVLLPMLGGYAWDALGIPDARRLAPIALGGAAIIALGRLPVNTRETVCLKGAPADTRGSACSR